MRLLLAQPVQIRRGKKIHRQQQVARRIVAVPGAPRIGFGQPPPAHPIPNPVMPFEDAWPHRQPGQLPCGRGAIPRQYQPQLPGQRRAHSIGQHHGVSPRRQRAHRDSHRQRSGRIRAEELRVGRRGLAARVQQVYIAQLELPALDERRCLFYRRANSLPCRGLLRQQIGLQRSKVLPRYRGRQAAGNRCQRIAVQRPQLSLRGAAHRAACQRPQQQRHYETAGILEDSRCASLHTSSLFRILSNDPSNV